MKKIERELEKLMQLYLNDAMPLDMVKERSGKLEARKNAIEATLAQAEEQPPLLHPSLAEVYRAKVTALHEALASDEVKLPSPPLRGGPLVATLLRAAAATGYDR